MSTPQAATAAVGCRCRVVVPAVGQKWVTGLSSSYFDEADFEFLPLEGIMTQQDFERDMRTLNTALLDHWPCLTARSVAYGCCICSLGLSMYSAAQQVKEAEDCVKAEMMRLNRKKKYKDRGIEWSLQYQTSCCGRSSWIEISYPEPVLENIQST